VTVTPAPTVTVNNATICSGSTATLTATPSTTGGTYLWSNNATSQVITVSPTTTTTYTVTYTASGCSPSTTSAIVTVNSSPTVTASNQTICSGNTATLQASGTPAGGTYSWSNGSTGSSISVTPTVTTTYTVTYTVNGCSTTQPSIVTVNPIPVVTATNATICSGGTATLSATANPAGGVFTWSTGATGSSISVSPTATTNYTVSYSVGGCNSAPVTAQVTVTPAPTVTVNNATICSGSTATLTATPSTTGGTYLWSNNATSQVITVSPTTTTTYTITYTVSGCSPITATGIVTVNSNPTVSLGGDTTLCDADFPFVLTAIASGTNNQFTWNTGDQTQSITITTGGTYTVNVTNSDGCSATDVIQVLSDPCAALNEEVASTFKLIPNPTQDVSILSTSGITVVRIGITNAEGQLLNEIVEIDGDVLIDLSKYSRGVYFIYVICKEGILVRKLVKQ